MKLFEVLKPLMESQARIEKTAEKYALKLAIVLITEEQGRNHGGAIDVENLDDIMTSVAKDEGVLDNYEDETNKDEVFVNAIKTIMKSEHSHKVVNKLKNMVTFVAEYFDPTPNKKYLEWIIRTYTKYALVDDKDYQSPDFFLEDSELVNDVLYTFHQHKKHLEKKDINQYKSFTELKQAVNPFMAELGEEKKQEIIGSGQAEVIYDKGGEKIVIPKTLQAAKVFSQGTEWCTQYPNMFEEYTSQGPLYIIDTPDPDNRIQIHFESNQIMDVDDKPIRLNIDEIHSEALDWLIDKIEEEADPNKALFLLRHGLISFSTFLVTMLDSVQSAAYEDDAIEILMDGLTYEYPETEEDVNRAIKVFLMASNLAYGFASLSNVYRSHGFMQNSLGIDFKKYVSITNEFLREAASPGESKSIFFRFVDIVNEMIEKGKLPPNDAMDAFKNSILSDAMKVKGITSLLQTVLRTTSPVDPNDDSPIAPDWYVELVKQEGPISLSNKRMLGILTDEEFIEALNDLPMSNEKQEAIDQFIRGRSEEEQQEILRRLGHES